MPIYEYACRSCGHEFEELQKISEKPLVKCPSCGDKSLVKKVSAAGFRLKGGGWYETDFKTKADCEKISKCTWDFDVCLEVETALFFCHNFEPTPSPWHNGLTASILLEPSRCVARVDAEWQQ